MISALFFFSCSSDAFCCGWGLHQREEEEALEIFSVLDGCLACGGRDFAPLTQFFLVHATISFFILKITHLKITLQKKKHFALLRNDTLLNVVQQQQKELRR